MEHRADVSDSDRGSNVWTDAYLRQRTQEVQCTVNPGGRLCMLRGFVQLYSMQVVSGSHVKFPRGSSAADNDKHLPQREVPVFALGI